MLVLFETPAGYSLFKLLDEKKLKNADDLSEEFSSTEGIQDGLKLMAFKKFKTTAEAQKSVIELQEGKISKSLKKLITSKLEEGEKLAVGDAKLGSALKEKLQVSCVHNNAVSEMMRSIRAHIDDLLGEHKTELDAMKLAVAHSLGRYKVKFNPEKIDTMIVQAVCLLDDLDKELNNYQMRCREWYGWHFPELGKILADHQAYAKVVKTIGMRQNAINCDLSSILPEDLETKVKEEAEISMGTDISEIDLVHIKQLCDQVIQFTEYRTQLFEYLKNRMSALAPNLTALLGELVGARLISHAGSLVSLAKYPASTVQILGAEKALFRALKTKKDTPKYGLIYHAQLISQAPAKIKGKMARKLAAKVSLSTRIDALADESKGAEIGIESRAALENVLRSEQERGPKKIGGTSQKHEKYSFKSETHAYDDSYDNTAKKSQKRSFNDDDEEVKPSSKKSKLIEEIDTEQTPSGKKKDKKSKEVKEEELEEEQPVDTSSKKKKNKKKQVDEDEEEEE